MKIYIVSLGCGLLVGLIYSLLQVRSPAPPVVALVGLLGMLIGEQAAPVAKWLTRAEAATGRSDEQTAPEPRMGVPLASAAFQHLFGELPSVHAPRDRERRDRETRDRETGDGETRDRDQR